MNVNDLLLRGATAACLAAALSMPALAGPGAHGPNGEHLDAPASAPTSADARPRVEAHSDAFELVGTLEHRGELSLLIDRFATNEPVLNAQVEVESGATKAIARFRTAEGDYAVDDAALLGQLAQPGSHPLVVTVIDGADSDLLEGTLQVSPTQPDAPGADTQAHAVASCAWLMPAAVAAALAALTSIGWWARRRSRRNDKPEAAR